MAPGVFAVCMTRYLPRSTPAVLLLMAALFFSAAGGAVAGGKITGKQIKNETITAKDVKDGTLGIKDLSMAAKQALTYELEYVEASSPATPVPPNELTGISAQCPTGNIVIGGHVEFADPATTTLVASGPLQSGGNGPVNWSAVVNNVGAGPKLVTVVAHCANLG